ncbi:MAG: ferredoxin [Pikeienuella sp.]
MMFEDISRLAAEDGLRVTGWFHPTADHGTPEGTQTLILLGYGGADLWAAFSGSAEYADGTAHPLDRWSTRIITALADKVGGVPLFPFGGPPYQPFIRWMYAGEPLHQSRLGMAIHPERGLWSGWRGAIALTQDLPLPPVPATNHPCEGCAAPCLTACPVGAFGDAGYDAALCRAHLNSGAGGACVSGGCLARRACPVGQEYAQTAEQGAFHLEAFRRA